MRSPEHFAKHPTICLVLLAFLFVPGLARAQAGNGNLWNKVARPTQATTACTSPSPLQGIVSRWTGNSTADDLLGVNNGALQNGATYASGVFESAFSLNDSTYAHVLVPDSPSLGVGTGDFTMDAWINTSSTKDVGTIQDKRDIRFGYRGYVFYIGNGGIGPGVQFSDGKRMVNVASSTFLADGKFHHVAVSVRRNAADGIRLFVDGKLVLYGDPRAASGSLDNNVPLLIGGHNIDAWRSFSGLIDEFELYKRALTDDEVKGIYLAGMCCEGGLPSVSVLISGKSGTQDSRSWAITLSNRSYCPALKAQIDGLKLTQTYGVACTPVITSPTAFPLALGDIAANGKATGDVTINFSACPSTARFTARITYSANDGTVKGSKTLNNQFR